MYSDPTGHVVLRLGMQNNDVKLLQQALGMVATGKFGKDTDKAVREFQRKAGLADDGVVGDNTKRALGLLPDEPTYYKYFMGEREKTLKSASGEKPTSKPTPKSTPKPSAQPSAQPSPTKTPEASKPFVPQAVEKVGGGLIADRSEMKPENMTTVKSYDGRDLKIDYRALEALNAMREAAKRDGIDVSYLSPVSVFRTVAEQQVIWDNKIKELRNAKPPVPENELESRARKFVAFPGNRAHHSGRAIDFKMMQNGTTSSNPKNIEAMKQTEVFQWLTDHAEEYGFYNYKVEPWHWDFNPAAN